MHIREVIIVMQLIICIFIQKIEKDNNKARQRARREFNEEIRALVAYVRKRDKRWLERKVSLNTIL